MQKLPLSSLVLCMMELVAIVLVALLVPEISEAHPVAFLLAAILVVMFTVIIELLNRWHGEQRLYQQAQHDLERSRLSTQVELALRGIGGGFAIVQDVEPKRFSFVSESLAALLGYTLEEFMESCGGRVGDIIHPDDYPLPVSGWEGESSTLRFRMRCRDGTYKWISSKGKVVINEKGERFRYSFNHDITLLMEHQKQLSELAAILGRERKVYRDAIIHGSDYAYIVNVDKNQIEDIYKAGFLEPYGFEVNAPYDETMARVMECMHPEMLSGNPNLYLTSHYREAYEQGERMVEVEYHIPDTNTYKRKSLFLSKDEEGEMRVFVVTRDITARRLEELREQQAMAQLAEQAQRVGTGDLNVVIDVDAPGQVGVLADVLGQTVLNLKWHMERLRQQATQDPMTGVKNKRVWQEAEQRLDAEIQEGTANFGVVVCDVNGLKQLNDTQGHEAGDALIIRASRHICRVFKHSPVYRIGGDEFTVILEGTDLEEREELVKLFYERLTHKEEEGVAVSVALGVATLRPEDRSFAEVFQRADARMYVKKQEMKAAIGLGKAR